MTFTPFTVSKLMPAYYCCFLFEIFHQTKTTDVALLFFSFRHFDEKSLYLFRSYFVHQRRKRICSFIQPEGCIFFVFKDVFIIRDLFLRHQYCQIFQSLNKLPHVWYKARIVRQSTDDRTQCISKFNHEKLYSKFPFHFCITCIHFRTNSFRKGVGTISSPPQPQYMG